MKIDLPRDFDAQTAKFSEILAKFNRVHSLTNYKNLNEQIADSIAPLEIFPQILDAKTAIDVGSGAGFPAIFLAMILRECEWYLFEPSPKKIGVSKLRQGRAKFSKRPRKILQDPGRRTLCGAANHEPRADENKRFTWDLQRFF